MPLGELTTQARLRLDLAVADFAAGRPTLAARRFLDVVHMADSVPARPAPAPDRRPAPPTATALDRLRARALLGLATAHFELDGPDAARAWLDRAQARADELEDEELRTLCHSQRATIAGRSGDLRGALAEMEIASRSQASLQPRDRAVLLLNHGTILLFLGRLHRAADVLARAAHVADGAGLSREGFMSRSNEGYVHYLTGNLPRALAVLEAAAAEATGADGAVVRLDRGRVLLEAGLLTEARTTLTSAAALCKSQRQGHLLGEIELELARVHGLLGSLEEGRQCARRARDRFRRRGATFWAARAEVVLGQLAIASPGRPRSVARAGAALLEQLRGGDVVLVGEQELVMAEVALRSGQNEAAIAHLAQAERVRTHLGVRDRLHMAHLQARLAVANGDPTRARRVLDRAAGLMVAEQASASSVDLRSALALHGVPLASLHVQLEVPRGARAVFECTERWRALSVGMRPVLPPEDSELAGRLTELREVREQLRQTEDPEGQTELRVRQASLQEVIRERSWALSGRPGAARQSGGLLPRVRRRLDEQDADLVSLVPYRGSVLAITVVRGRCRLTEVPSLARMTELARRVRADLDAAGHLRLGGFHDTVWASLRTGMAGLDAELIEPLGLGSRRLVIVHPRALAAVPWALAPSLRGVPFVVSPSARDWAARSALPPTHGERAPVVTAVAGPGLGMADEEVSRVHATWPGAVRHTSATARMENLRHALTESDVVHVAAHGTHHQQSPMFASVQLRGGPLYVYDLEHTGVRARHIVLSACDVGRSQIRAGEEPIGLAAGLLRLGAGSVLAGTCRVPDDVSARTMTAYHAALSRGVAADLALAGAVEQEGGIAAAFQVFGASWQAPTMTS